MTSMQNDAHKADFIPIAGFDYWKFWYTCNTVIDIYESNLEPWNLLDLNVVCVGE